MKVGLRELLEAIDRRTKLRKVPRGVKVQGLHEAAFLPALNGMWVEMPGGRHFVVSRGGALPSEILFETKRLVALRKPLGSFLGREQEVRACRGRCGLSVRLWGSQSEGEPQGGSVG